MKTTVITVANVNNVDIQIIENGEKQVAVKPICQALGISFEAQFIKLKTDPILRSVVMTSITTGSDKKRYEMVTIPLKYVFGWLFRIDSRNVKEDAREAVKKYQIACYDALYNYFTRRDEYLAYRQKKMDETFHQQIVSRSNFAFAKNLLKEANIDFRKWMNYSMEEYEAEKAQMKLDFTEGKEANNE